MNCRANSSETGKCRPVLEQIAIVAESVKLLRNGDAKLFLDENKKAAEMIGGL